MPIRFRFLISFGVVFILAMVAASLTVYSLVRGTIEANIESELKNSTDSLLNTVRTAAATSIKNHLRAVAEKNLEITALMHKKELSGELDPARARGLASEILLSQRIGTTGYIYCLDSAGTVVVHPSEALKGVNVSEHAFVRDQIRMREGYLEYDWKNPGETTPRPKALYMTYYEPWDWIISVSTYREEFDRLVNVSDLRESVLSLKFGRSGYAYVVNGKGKVLIHPLLEGKEVGDLKDADFFREMFERKSGMLTYEWQNPDEWEPREKLVIFNYLPEFDWVVASSIYLDEMYAPLTTLRWIVGLTVVGCLALALPVTFRISARVTEPLKVLTERFSQGATGDFSVRIDPVGEGEIGQVERYFNTFMRRLEEYDGDLRAEMAERRRLERELLEGSDRERRRMGMALHDDLAPHLCGVEMMTKLLASELESSNPAAAREADNLWLLIGDAIEKTRRLSRGTYPMVVAGSGFEYALRELAETTERYSGVACRVTTGSLALPISDEAATQLYYIAGEAVHNAVRHAGARLIRLHLSREGGSVRLEIADDGAGFNPERCAGEGIGLKLMGFRAANIGASLSILSEPGTGTRVTVTLATEGRNSSGGTA